MLYILEVDILNNFENDKDETCLECGSAEFCGCNYSFDLNDETFELCYDDYDDDIDSDDNWDDDYWDDTYDCGCCMCCGCTCDDDWDEDEF